MLTPPIEQAIKEKYIFDFTVLDVSDVDVSSTCDLKVDIFEITPDF